MKKVLCLCLAWLVLPALADAPMPLSAFPQSTLQIATPDARLHRFNVWIAQDDAHRAQGLMFVKQLPPDAGMLFIYPLPHRISMWMKNTLIPLDMLFIRADGRVASVVANTKPLSLENIDSCLPQSRLLLDRCADPKEDVIGVLELNGGTAARLNIRKGALVMHPAFNKSEAAQEKK